jgi:hypothetical protein
MLILSIDNIFLQTIGIPMGTHGAVLFADLKVNSTTYTEKSASFLDQRRKIKTRLYGMYDDVTF